MKNFWKNKKVLITGAAGFIGSHAVEALIEEGAIVTAVVSPTTKDAKIKQNLGSILKNILLKKADLLKLSDCLKVTRNQEIVLNFAAMDGGAYFKLRHPAKIFRVNSQIVINMLEASVHNNIDRFLLISSTDVYPRNLPSRVNEKYGLKDGLNETNGYAWAKRLAELTARMYHKEHGLKISIARLGNTYGPRDYADKEKSRVIPTFITESLRGKDLTIIGDGLQERTFLYVVDLISSLIKLIEKYPKCEPINIASCVSITMKDLAYMIIALTESKSKVIFKKNDIGFVKKRKISINKARKIIRFNEKFLLKEGLIETIKYYKSFQ